MHARLDRGVVRLPTRTGLDWTNKYPAIGAAIALLPARQLCGVRPDGTTAFSLIQNASDTRNAGALVYFVFDLLHLDGEALGASLSSERNVFATCCRVRARRCISAITRSGAGGPSTPQEKGATTSFTASVYWKFESTPLQRLCPIHHSSMFNQTSTISTIRNCRANSVR
jgi:hypothetical protein